MNTHRPRRKLDSSGKVRRLERSLKSEPRPKMVTVLSSLALEKDDVEVISSPMLEDIGVRVVGRVETLAVAVEVPLILYVVWSRRVKKLRSSPEAKDAFFERKSTAASKRRLITAEEGSSRRVADG